ncbi:prolyl oligopeptidase family serine peptidase [Actinomadura sp. LD22]|uniref:Prolyl oligopeptidase family serine peptidase n=1 Tax=Actinomadura physcomitrii TaxID=2650748 RepID=A0A6I4M006_9ACTN|nr:prolyl oligopeptidase family serine peptidase [Actinomadura physcomitrii]MVZ99052.1 prolyl oligopeptidase family serine peptidase [Actinomadura physcomitrii]
MIPIPADQVAEATTALDAVQVLRGGAVVYWLEGRPDGHDVLVRWTPEDGARDVLPPGTDVASYVHEYGGGAYYATDTEVWFCYASDQRIYRTTDHKPVPVTSATGARYTDMRPGATGLWTVRERHEGDRVVNDLAWIPASGSPRTAASGWDFYSFPRPSPDGRWLAWTCWNAPTMPWDGTTLYIAEILDDSGTLSTPQRIAGGPDESVFQPEWSPDGVLHFISDRTGWWNLYRWTGDRVEPVLQRHAELGVAQWEFGYSTYTFLDDAIAVLVQQGGTQTIELLRDGKTSVLDLPYTSIKPYLSGSATTIAAIASNPQQPPQIVLIDAATGHHQPLTTPATHTHPATTPEPFSFPTRDGNTAHGLYHSPPAAGGPPPLIVKAHPGPTANTPLRLDWHTQYFTSRGYAVAEIDYRGSTGYGRAYRQALHSQWGLLDAHDCADAATHLAATGRADPDRTVIWGASAGGYTALRALATTDTFTAAIAHCPVIDPATWRDAAPKFQAHHADTLIGPWPDTAPTYEERSLLHHPEDITRPVLILHGDNDPITPPAQSRALAAALGAQARLLTFPGEGHVLRSPESIKQALTAEENFLADLPDTAP